jgi:hypothetical protein
MLNGVEAESMFVTSVWASYKARTGWTVNRVAVFERSNDRIPIACIVLQRKCKFGIRMWFAQGGLQSREKNEDKLDEILKFVVGELITPCWRDLILVNYYSDSRECYQRALLNSGFSPVITSGNYSLFLDVNIDLSLIEKKLSSNWRHNLKRARKNESLSVHWCVDAASRVDALASMGEMYDTLCDRKGFAAAIDLNLATDLILHDDRYLIAVAKEGQKPMAVRIGFAARTELVDFLAASCEEAKTTYANYLLFWAFISRANEMGLRGFECGGIDPQRNRGTYNFKRGAAGRLVQLGPVWVKHNWDWVQRSLVPAFFGWASR